MYAKDFWRMLKGILLKAVAKKKPQTLNSLWLFL